tara:strand:+ start:575 stop:727 length:153 start_codon:yes stop_codon:yes gene_type:complete
VIVESGRQHWKGRAEDYKWWSNFYCQEARYHEGLVEKFLEKAMEEKNKSD